MWKKIQEDHNTLWQWSKDRGRKVEGVCALLMRARTVHTTTKGDKCRKSCFTSCCFPVNQIKKDCALIIFDFSFFGAHGEISSPLEFSLHLFWMFDGDLLYTWKVWSIYSSMSETSNPRNDLCPQRNQDCTLSVSGAWFVCATRAFGCNVVNSTYSENQMILCSSSNKKKGYSLALHFPLL